MNVCQSTELPRGLVLLVFRAPHGPAAAAAQASLGVSRGRRRRAASLRCRGGESAARRPQRASTVHGFVVPEEEQHRISDIVTGNTGVTS